VEISKKQHRSSPRPAGVDDINIGGLLLCAGTTPTRKKKSTKVAAPTEAAATSRSLIEGVHAGVPLHHLQLRPPEQLDEEKSSQAAPDLAPKNQHPPYFYWHKANYRHRANYWQLAKD
jgi:hypothetical protein